ncbi:hypothetical protein GALMADRAFT_565377 [Galerina marginata CBS 339.88]|uniref:F-box domain-containing protein n=1 Tax=Galerina marginata (strain CBS 339.88) TaxID=685588 RepID=A0A067T4J9_GALM3|nr:hypothetical protein GALMADRAFT_565377 [Galerina marginata CBS 339.88]
MKFKFIPCAASSEYVGSGDSDSPISRLNDDILQSIFLINTGQNIYFQISYQYSYCPHLNNIIHPMTTARRTSQVCHKWRELIVQSPVIWAKIIDLGLLARKKNEWRNEILRRTGEATLCITGPLDWKKSAGYFCTLLARHWERVQKLDVWVSNFCCRGKLATVPTLLTDIMACPAPALEFIRILTSESTPDKSIIPLCPPISGNVSAPWIPQLRAITVYDGIDPLALLAKTPLLESLRIEPSRYPLRAKKHRNASRIDLPRLNKIFITQSFRDIPPILDSINPAPHCVLQLICRDFVEGITDGSSDIPALNSLLKQYCAGYFSLGDVQKLRFYLTENRFYIGTDLKATPGGIVLYFEVYTGRLPTIVPSFIMDCVASSQLHSITTLQLDFFPDITPLRRDVLEFFMACPSVQSIQPNQFAFEVLCAFTKEGHIVFPLLCTLVIGGGYDLIRSDQVKYADKVLLFLKMRENMGRPLTLLNLADCSSHRTEDVEYWDKSAKVNIRRRNRLCVSRTGLEIDFERCHGCGIAQINDVGFSYTHPVKYLMSKASNNARTLRGSFGKISNMFPRSK